MKILITGGCGFIGVNVLHQLKGKGHDITVLDNLSMGKKEDLDPFPQVTLVEGDIKDFDTVSRAVAGQDAIIHLAAHTRVIESVEAPRANMEDNVIGTFNIFEAARVQGVKRVAFASTGGAIIGDAEPPVHEELVPRPISPYGAGKLCCEAYASAYAGAYGITAIGLRFANVYGPYSYRKGSVVALYFKNLLSGIPFTIYGDGTQTRDYVFSEDLAALIVKSLTAPVEGFETFHVGAGEETTLLKLIETMREVTGKPIDDIQYQPVRAGEIYRNYTLIGKAQKILGYKPAHGLKEGLEKTWQWFLDNKERL